MVKFRIGFTIDAQTMFAYISKFFPNLDDLHVEEMPDSPVIKQQSIVAKLVEKGKQKIDTTKPPIRRRKYDETGKTIEKFILEFMESQDGKTATWGDINKHIIASGFGRSSCNNKLDALMKKGQIEKLELGLYKLKE
jgi:hypothetical protein